MSSEQSGIRKPPLVDYSKKTRGIILLELRSNAQSQISIGNNERELTPSGWKKKEKKKKSRLRGKRASS